MGCVGSHERSDVLAERPAADKDARETPTTTSSFAFLDDSRGAACKPLTSTASGEQPMRLSCSSGSGDSSSGMTLLGIHDIMGSSYHRATSAQLTSTSTPLTSSLFVRGSFSVATPRGGPPSRSRSSVSLLGAHPPALADAPRSGTSSSSGGCGGGPRRACQDADAQTEAFRLEVRETGPTMPVRWKKGESIGSGSFGTVFLGLNSQTGELLAVKEVAVLDAGRSTEAVEQLEREVNLLSQLNHPNIVRYVGTARENTSLYIFLEYVPGGSIASLLSRFGPLEEMVIRIYTRQLLSGLAYLHAQRTVHRDVKGANLLVEKNGRVKLADFGMAKQMVEQVSFTVSFKGSAFWMAPEVIKQQGHGIAADIWSVGCTVLEMATGKPPWAQCSTQVQAIFKIASSTDLPSIPDSLSPEASEFILLCLQRDPALRPSAETLLRHAFVSSMCAEDVPALAGPTVDWVGGPASRAAPAGCAYSHTDPADCLPGSLNSSLQQAYSTRLNASHRVCRPGDHTSGGGGLVAGGRMHSASWGPPQPLPLQHQHSPPLASREDDGCESLAALVLGTALHQQGKHRGGGGGGGSYLNGSMQKDGGGGGGAGSRTGSGGGAAPSVGGGAALRGGGGSSACHLARDATTSGDLDAGESADLVDYTTQPRQFKVRGLLSLPPLSMLQGQLLPPVLCQTLPLRRPRAESPSCHY